MVVISEIHYNPAGGADDLEFIELENLFSVDVDLSNWSLGGAVGYHFPVGTKIPARGRLVIAREPSALQSATGFSGALGPWTGALNNGGEKVQLLADAIGARTMDEVDYSDGGQWPQQADGSGASLEKIKATLPGIEATSWTWSQTTNGTPGVARAGTALPKIAFNEIQALSNPSFFVEIHNYGTISINLNGYVIASSDETRNDVTLSVGTLAASGFVTVNAATLGYMPADGEKLFLFTPSKSLVVDSIKMGTSVKARFPDGTGRFHLPTAVTPGSANTVVVSSDIVINEILYNGYPDPSVAALPPTFSSTAVIPFSSSWKYKNSSAGESPGWQNSAHASWASGNAAIGHETSPAGVQTNFYNAGQITYYFEKEFNHSGAIADTQIRITHRIDDGAVFYLNGVELQQRYNMPSGTVTSSTLASGVIEFSEQVFTVPATSLVNGSNRFSVEVHQGSTNSSDILFDAQIEILTQTIPGTPAIPFKESDEEWIELHNKGNDAVNLGGWRLDDAVDFDFDANTSIPVGGYLVIAKNPTAFAAKYPGVTVVGPWNGSLSNSGERIQLEDSNGNPVDEVTYRDGGRWHDFADGGGCSLELRDPRADNSLPESWAPSATNVAWKTYTYEAVATDNGFGFNNFNELNLGMLDAGEVLIDDVSVIEDPDGSPVQFIQNGDFESATIGTVPSDWRAMGNHGIHGQTQVINDGGNKVLKLVATSSTKEFHNQLQKTFVSGRSVTVGKTYRISYRAKWLRGDNQLNTRLFFDYLSNTHMIDVDQNWGTPGEPNSSVTTNLGPVCSSLAHSPTVPAASQAVTVTATLIDPDGIGSVTLNYRKNNESSFSSVAMSHQGNGIYQGMIPGSSGGTIAQFYIEAADSHASAAASSTFPAAGTHSRAMFQWQDGQANTATLHNLRVIMRPSDRQLLNTDIHRMSNHRFGATLIVNESEVYYDISARLKGSASGRNFDHRVGLNIGFDPLQPFNGVHSSISIERGDFEKQTMAKHLMNNSGHGVASMYDDPIRLVFPSDSLGNTSRTGLALVSAARYSSAWRQGQFENGSKGTLYNFELLYNPTTTSGPFKKFFPYNHTNGSYEFDDLPLGKETYRWGFQIRSNQRKDDYAPVINTSKAMTLSGSARVSEVAKYIDVNQWARTWAFMGLVGNDDTYTRIFDHNFRMFARPSDDRLVAMPWDLDRSFRLSTSSSLIGGRNLGSYLNEPTVKRLFMQHVQHLCATSFTSSYASTWANHYGSKTGLSFSSFPSYVQNRCNYAISQLPANVNFAITSNGGNNFSVAASSAILQGNGWINVASIQINGAETPVTWVDDDSWQVTVPLAVGANATTLTAHDLNGTQVGTDSITITNASTTDLASPANLVLTELMYHPLDTSAAEQTAGFTSDDDFEFIELLNISANEIDLSNCSFTDGITFIVPAGTLLSSDARIIIASNPEAFAMRYGNSGKQVIGGYTGKLSNGGETLTMAAADSAEIFSFTYSDSGDWPSDSDGDGYSLVNLDPVNGTDLNLASNWSPSRTLGGGSGAADLFTYTLWLTAHPALAAASMTGENDDFDKDGYVNLLEYALNSDPTDPASVPDMPTATAEIDTGSGPTMYFTHSITRPIAIPRVSYTPESCSALNNDWDVNPATTQAVFLTRTRTVSTETITYRSKLPLSNINRLFIRFKIQK